MKTSKIYEAPLAEVQAIAVEQGFATTGSVTWNDGFDDSISVGPDGD